MLRVNVRCSYTLEVEGEEIPESENEYDFSSDEEHRTGWVREDQYGDDGGPSSSSHAHFQLCDEEDFYSSTLRSAEQALLTMHASSLFDSENEDAEPTQENFSYWSAICNQDTLVTIESDAESVSTERGASLHGDDGDDDDDDVSLDVDDDDVHAHRRILEEDDNGDEGFLATMDERRLHLAALPLRQFIQSEIESELESSYLRGRFHGHPSLHTPGGIGDDDAARPAPHRRVVRQYFSSGASSSARTRRGRSCARRASPRSTRPSPSRAWRSAPCSPPPTTPCGTGPWTPRAARACVARREAGVVSRRDGGSAPMVRRR